MVARGDLSIETAFTRVPIVQKAVIAEANRRAKPAITATQMLYSMVDSPTPDARRGGGRGQRDRGRQRRRHALGGDGDRAPPGARGPDDGGDRGGHRSRRALEGRRVGSMRPAPLGASTRPWSRPACRLAARLDVDGDRHRSRGTGRPRAWRRSTDRGSRSSPSRHSRRDLPPAGARPGGGAGPARDDAGRRREALVAAARAVAQEHGWGGRPGIVRRPRPRAVRDGLRTGDRGVVGVTRPGGARPVRRCGLMRLSATAKS